MTNRSSNDDAYLNPTILINHLSPVESAGGLASCVQNHCGLGSAGKEAGCPAACRFAYDAERERRIAAAATTFFGAEYGFSLVKLEDAALAARAGALCKTAPSVLSRRYRSFIKDTLSDLKPAPFIGAVQVPWVKGPDGKGMWTPRAHILLPKLDKEVEQRLKSYRRGEWGESDSRRVSIRDAADMDTVLRRIFSFSIGMIRERFEDGCWRMKRRPLGNEVLQLEYLLWLESAKVADRFMANDMKRVTTARMRRPRRKL